MGSMRQMHKHYKWQKRKKDREKQIKDVQTEMPGKLKGHKGLANEMPVGGKQRKGFIE